MNRPGRRVAPLRDRLEDVPLLVDHFLEIDRASAPPGSALSASEVASFRARAWRGNVRELRNAVRQALAGLGDEIDIGGPPVFDPEGLLTLDKEGAERAFERWYVTALVGRHKTRAAAARAMNIERSTLYKRMRILGIGGGDAD